MTARDTDSSDQPTAPEYEPGYVYLQIADRIAARIESGELARHERLPAEQDMANEFGVSLGTARHATRVLRDRGLVFTIRSKGTFVADRSRHTGGE